MSTQTAGGIDTRLFVREDEPQMPFGGVKDSGFGRFGGTAVVEEFTETRWITVERPHPFPF